MIEKIEENRLMQAFYDLIPYLDHFLGTDLIFTISNTERFLLVKDNENMRMSSKTGDLIPNGCAADVCLRKQEKVYVMVPEKVFGIPLKTMAVPVFVDDKIEGTIVIGMNIQRNQKILELSDKLSQSLSEISASTVDMSSRVKEISETNEGIEEFIHKTGEQTKKTDEVLGFVESIAKQTNLLGLNAAIESARAGEYGKGFSVVSNEIRKLSQSTKESVQTIGSTLKSIKESVNEIEERFDASNKLLEGQTDGIEKISESIADLNLNAADLQDFAKEF